MLNFLHAFLMLFLRKMIPFFLIVIIYLMHNLAVQIPSSIWNISHEKHFSMKSFSYETRNLSIYSDINLLTNSITKCSESHLYLYADNTMKTELCFIILTPYITRYVRVMIILSFYITIILTLMSWKKQGKGLFASSKWYIK